MTGQGVSEHIQALVYTSVHDVIFHLRVEGERFRFLQVNPAFTRATGLAADKVVGSYVDEVIPEPSLSLVLGKYRQAMEERRTVRWEEATEYPTGTRIGEVAVTPVFEADRCTQLVGTVTDVTETRAQRQTIQLYADLVQSVQMGISIWKVSDPDDVGSIRLVAFNPEASRQVSMDLSTSIGKGILEILPALRDSKLPTLIASVARDGVVRDEPELRSVMDRARVMSVKAFPLPERTVGLAIDDVSLRVRAAHLQAGERRALEMLASGAPSGEVLRVIVGLIEELEPGTVASILLVDETGTKLRHGAAPHLPDAYNRAIDGAAISEKAGRFVRHRRFSRQAGLRHRHLDRPALGRLPRPRSNDRDALLLVHADPVERRERAWDVCSLPSHAQDARRAGDRHDRSRHPRGRDRPRASSAGRRAPRTHRPDRIGPRGRTHWNGAGAA